MLEKLMSNPYVLLLLAVCTVGSLLFGIYTWLKGKKYKAFSFSQVSNLIVRSGKKLIPQIKFTFNNNEIHNLTVTKVAIWNSGNEVINNTDIVDGKELAIAVPDNVEILSAEIVGVSDETNQFAVAKTDAQSSSLTFDYVEGNDGVVVQLFHTGLSDDISVSCKIKGGRPVKDANLNMKEPRFMAKVDPLRFMTVAYVIMGAILTGMNICYLLALFIPSLYQFLCGPVVHTYEQFLFLTISITAMTVIIDLMSVKMLKRTFRLQIPIKLRKFM